MATRRNDPRRILDTYSPREINWIYSKLRIRAPKVDTCEQKRRLIEDYSNENNTQYQEVIDLHRESQSYLLEEKEFEWIDWEESRFLGWLKFELSRRNPFDVYMNEDRIFNIAKDVPNYRVREYFLTDLDSWNTRYSKKSNLLKRAKSSWYQIIQRDKKLTWIEKDNEKQVEWAWQYISGHIEARTIPVANSFRPTNSAETYSNIFTIFDTWKGHPAELREFQAKMKQAWAQQKYRANLKGRKQSTFVLTTQTISQLKELAQKRRLPIHEVLEHIIEDEHKRFAHPTNKQ